MTTVPLYEFGDTVLDGSGDGTVRLGPSAHGVVWRPKVVSIKMTGAIPSGVATCFVYAGNSATDQFFVDATYNVKNNATGKIEGQEIRLGQYVFGVWDGATAGATATVVVSGEKDIPGG